MNKIGFFYQTSHNPCAVEMNLTQIKKYHPDSPIVIWEDVSNLCEEICKKYNVPYKKVYRLNEDTQFHQSQPVTELTGGLRYLNRIYVSCMNELKDADWIIHYEDDVWIKNTIFSTLEEKELHSFWTKNLISKNAKIENLIELLDADIYSNEALIALGEKLLKTIKNKPNKFQNLFNVYFKIGNCYFYNNEPKKALKFYKKAAVFLNYIDVHHHFFFYLNLAKTKKSIGLVTEIEDRNVIYFYLSKESWEKKLYKNDLKEYFQFSA